MAPISNQKSNYCNSLYGEEVAHRVNVLASCYIVDSASSLKGLHYCTSGAAGLSSPPSSPPLAALTSSNELALLPKQRKHDSVPGRRLERRGGAALVIREECERFFCETMGSVFLGERNPPSIGSGLTGAFAQMQTPPPDYHFERQYISNGITTNDNNNNNNHNIGGGGGGDAIVADRRNSDAFAGFGIDAWMEVWDFAGGASFRAFQVNDGREKSLFIFFDAEGVMGRDLKKALMALIELGDGPLGCAHIVTCIDRRLPAEKAHELIKSLQWVGFEMTTLDHWANGLDVTSKEWVFMGMEL